MFGKKKPAVLIAGAGPVGLFAAIVLTKRGVPVCIVDKTWRSGARSDALALHAASLRLLADVGISPPCLRVDTIQLDDVSAHRAEIRLGAPGDESSCLAVIPQSALEHALEEALRKLGVRVLWQHNVAELTVHDHGVVVTIEELDKQSMGYAVEHTEWVVERSKQIEVPFVIGADGGHSIVRRLLGIDFPSVGPAQDFAMFEVQASADLGHTLRIVMDDRTTSSVWPLLHGHCRWCFELHGVAAPEAWRIKDCVGGHLRTASDADLDDDRLRTLVAERMPWFEGTIEEINWRVLVRFENRLATAFGKHRVWLAGDAGHMTGPIGMQSMNVGLREAHDLAELLAAVLDGGQSVQALDQYNRERINEWQHLLGLTSGSETSGPAALIAERRNRLVARLPASGARLRSLIAQLNSIAE
jgi:2-polyprenyl-6-methoxyphenol hydroxylase-like FAD-dependent oxidoreductase